MNDVFVAPIGEPLDSNNWVKLGPAHPIPVPQHYKDQQFAARTGMIDDLDGTLINRAVHPSFFKPKYAITNETADLLSEWIQQQ